jgi:hypothetical protein
LEEWLVVEVEYKFMRDVEDLGISLMAILSSSLAVLA